MLDLCFDLESRVSAVFLLKFRGREAILGREQSRNMPNFGRESPKLPKLGQECPSRGRESRSEDRAQSQLNFFQNLS